MVHMYIICMLFRTYLKGNLMGFLKNFIELTRGYALLVTFASCFIIYAFAQNTTHISKPIFLIMVLALCAVHLGANLYDDYRDIKAQMQRGKSLDEVYFNGFTPKARLILNKTFSLELVRKVIFSLFIFATGVGIAFVLSSGWFVLVCMLLGAILTLLYPISSKHNCAEIVVGAIYGPLMIMGGYYALTGELSFKLFVLSIAIFFTTIILLHTHSIMDWEFDIKNGKKTLAILSGSKDNAIKLLIVMIAISYLIVLIGALSGFFKLTMLFVFFTLPIATKLVSSMQEYILIKNVEFKPRWYWGFFENWKEIQERKIDFFMFRFYLARNYLFFFALFASIGAMI